MLPLNGKPLKEDLVFLNKLPDSMSICFMLKETVIKKKNITEKLVYNVQMTIQMAHFLKISKYRYSILLGLGLIPK